MKSFDVAVVGGGPAGAATAISLLHAGYSVVVVERSRFEKIRFGETLVPQVRQLLAQLGVWQRFLDDGHRQSYGIQSAWEEDELYNNDFIFNPFGSGWHLDRSKFDSMLLDAAEQRGALVFREAVISVRPRNFNEEWKLVVHAKAGQIPCRSRFLVDATGRVSSIAKALGATRQIFDGLIGVAAFFSTGRDNILGGYTLIESMEMGWWYSAELPNDRAVVVFMTDADIYARARKRSHGFWREVLASSYYTKHRCEHLRMISDPQPLAANTSRLYPVADAHWLAVGDAALSFDPLSSQGIYKALASGISAAVAIDSNFHGERDALAHYMDTMDNSFIAYKTARSAFYEKVKRWPESDFWKRRISELRPYYATAPALTDKIAGIPARNVQS